MPVKSPAQTRELPPVDQAAVERSDQTLFAIVEYVQAHGADPPWLSLPPWPADPVECTRAMYESLVAAFAYQGMSDAAVRTFADRHGAVTWNEVATSLDARPACPKLQSHWHFADCGYQRSAGTCSRPEHYPTCPLPELPLRRGTLNQAAYSLFLFIRDVCDGDLASWLNIRLGVVRKEPIDSYGQRLAAAVSGPLLYVYGVSQKVVSMALADLLMRSSTERPLWHIAGSNLVAIDTLVHNLLARTGSLAAHGAVHLYGPLCYASGSCRDMVCDVAERSTAFSPRLLQHALWQFCAQEQLDICNGNYSSKEPPCANVACPVRSCCRMAQG